MSKDMTGQGGPVLEESWMTFVEIEFNAFDVSLITVLLYCLIAAICSTVVRHTGPWLLRGEYYERVSQFSLDSKGALNIAYRIVAPVLISYSLELIITAIAGFFGLRWIPVCRWIPILLYWFIQAVAITANYGKLYPVWTIVFQAVISLSVSVYFDWAVIIRLPEYGIAAFDQSNIGWQLLVAAFLAISNIVLSGIAAGASRYSKRVSLTKIYDGELMRSRFVLDSSTEGKLQSYLRSFDSMLPSRFKEDRLLKAFFYTVMLIEDSNRPAWRRSLEKMLFSTGWVKSTGIMQVKSKDLLSNERSVELSIPIVEAIWDSFILEASRKSSDNNQPILYFTSDWYCYHYIDLLKLTCSASSSLYGRYCGTCTLDIEATFLMVEQFMLSEGCCTRPCSIMVLSQVFCDYAWLTSPKASCFIDNELTPMYAIHHGGKQESVLTIRTNDPIDIDALRHIMSGVLDRLEILSALMVGGRAYELTFRLLEDGGWRSCEWQEVGKAIGLPNWDITSRREFSGGALVNGKAMRL